MGNADNKFRIGEFTFDSYHEYRDGQEDLKKIELINKELDVHDPKVAVRLYNMIKTGEIVFKSPIGDQFYQHLADIAVDKSEGLIAVNDAVDEAEAKLKKEKIIAYVIIAIAVIFFAYFAIVEISEIIQTRKQANWQSQVETDKDNSSKKSSSKTKTEDGLTVLPEYQNLYSQNNELVGWLKIDGTDINYPVCQKEKDNEYYLKHAFDGSDDSNGTLFVDYRSNIVNETSNTIIYGHNMKTGKMFGQLKYYQDKDFYNQHKTILFDTIYEKREYEVIAVGLSKVVDSDSSDYRYYNYIQAANQAELTEFIDNIKSLALYHDDLNVSMDDKLLTLSTCNSYTENGRLFVVAKRTK